MTRKEAKELLPIIQAFAEGKTIYGIYKGLESPWMNVEDLVLDGGTKYRIKPEPEYRPFGDAEECWKEMRKHQPFGWTKRKDGGYFLVTGIQDGGCNFGKGCFADTFEKYTFADGAPFGIKEEED